MYLPVAIAAGEANLAIDDVKAEGDATAYCAVSYLNCGHVTACCRRERAGRERTSPQRLLRKLLRIHAGHLEQLIVKRRPERVALGVKEKRHHGEPRGDFPAYPALMSSRPITAGQLLRPRRDVVPGRAVYHPLSSAEFFFFFFSPPWASNCTTLTVCMIMVVEQLVSLARHSVAVAEAIYRS